MGRNIESYCAILIQRNSFDEHTLTVIWGSKACKTPLNSLTVKLLSHIQIIWKN